MAYALQAIAADPAVPVIRFLQLQQQKNVNTYTSGGRARPRHPRTSRRRHCQTIVALGSGVPILPCSRAAGPTRTTRPPGFELGARLPHEAVFEPPGARAPGSERSIAGSAPQQPTQARDRDLRAWIRPAARSYRDRPAYVAPTRKPVRSARRFSSLPKGVVVNAEELLDGPGMRPPTRSHAVLIHYWRCAKRPRPTPRSSHRGAVVGYQIDTQPGHRRAGGKADRG